MEVRGALIATVDMHCTSPWSTMATPIQVPAQAGPLGADEWQWPGALGAERLARASDAPRLHLGGQVSTLHRGGTSHRATDLIIAPPGVQ